MYSSWRVKELIVESEVAAARADHRRVLELFDGAERGAVNTRMVNLVLSAELELGTDADTAAVRMLQRCSAHGLEPTAALHNNVLGAMSRSSPPEVVSSWIRRMAESGVRLDALEIEYGESWCSAQSARS